LFNRSNDSVHGAGSEEEPRRNSYRFSAGCAAEEQKERVRAVTVDMGHRAKRLTVSLPERERRKKGVRPPERERAAEASEEPEVLSEGVH
jgi:hypothetical protein